MSSQEIQRHWVPQPMSSQPYDAWTPPKPRDAKGELIQVTAHVDEFGHVVERWQFSETDVRWYRLEKYEDRWVSIKVAKRTAVS
jgi:hypothetical protein